LLQPLIARWTGIGEFHAEPTGSRRLALVAFQFFVAGYGGYFGAGIGILMLSALSLMGIRDVHRMNAAKTLLAAAINAVAIVMFIWAGAVHWPFAVVMAVAASAGGYAGGHYGRLLPRECVRWLVIGIGMGLSVKYFAER
jgi:hypothetical protein